MRFVCFLLWFQLTLKSIILSRCVVSRMKALVKLMVSYLVELYKHTIFHKSSQCGICLIEAAAVRFYCTACSAHILSVKSKELIQNLILHSVGNFFEYTFCRYESIDRLFSFNRHFTRLMPNGKRLLDKPLQTDFEMDLTGMTIAK